MENAGEETEDNIENHILIDPIDHYYFKNDFNMNQYNVLNIWIRWKTWKSKFHFY